MTTDYPSGQPSFAAARESDNWRLPPPSSGGDGGGGKIVRIETPAGSPRWLKIARDALLSVAALLLIISWVYAVVAVNRVGNALDEIGNTTTSTSSPDNGGLPTCEPGQQFGCVDPGD